MLSDLIEFFRGVREELKKVVWPSRELVIRATVAVIIFTFFFSIYLWILDIIFGRIVSLVFNLI